jgi:hypothetical protein
MLQLDEKTISTADDIILGNDRFKIIESPGKIIFYDAERDDGLSITGDFDNNVIKNDMLESFKEKYERKGALDLRIYEIKEYIWNNKTDNDGIYRIEGAYLNIPGNQENVWIRSPDEKETRKHTFGDTTVSFSVHPSSLHDQETTIAFGREEFKGKEGDFRSGVIDINGNIDTAKNLVYNVIKHFDQAQDIRMSDISLYLESKNRDILQGAEFSSPQDFMDTVQLAKKAGYVQGVCECVAAIGDDYTLGKKLLSEMNVTKDTAKKFANPETFKVLEQGIFAPQHKLEQTHNIKR